MRIERSFTEAGQDPYARIEWRTALSEIRNPDGSVVFRLDDAEVPAAWSQVAVDVLAQKYFRKAGLPTKLVPAKEKGVPAWLQRHLPDPSLEGLPKNERTKGEHSAKQVFDRLAGTWTYWGWKGGYFDTEDDARTFFDELRFMLAKQMAAPNSPQWFNTGLHWAYGIDGPAQGHFYVDHKSGAVAASTSAYERPQPHACFIQSINDDLVNEGGIMDLWVREARLFKYGSGTGTNFSRLRGLNEPLSGGGKSSGLMSFLKIGDRAAGAIKSGGTTRRAAKMVTVDVDHPDIEEYVMWKVVEEQKVAALVAGSTLLKAHVQAILSACHDATYQGTDRFDPLQNLALRKAVRDAKKAALAPGSHAAGDPVRKARVHADRGADLPGRLGQRGLRHRVRPELQQLGARLRRVHRQGPGQRRVDADPPDRRRGQEDHPRQGSVGQDRPGCLGVRRSGHPVRHHHQRLAHLPGLGADQRVQSVLGIHVPGRHGV